MKNLFITTLLLFLQTIIAQNNSDLDYAYKQETSQENNELKNRISVLPNEAKTINSLIAQSIRSKEYTKAFEYTNQLDSIVPNNSDIKNFQGKLYIILNDYDSAVISFDEAIAINPINKWLYINKAGALSEKGEFENALLCVDVLIELFPNWSIGYNLKGGILQRLNRDKEALSTYKKAIQCEPKSALISTNMGDLNLKLNNKEQAILDYKNALQIQPDYQLANERLKTNL